MKDAGSPFWFGLVGLRCTEWVLNPGNKEESGQLYRSGEDLLQNCRVVETVLQPRERKTLPINSLLGQ